MIDPITVGLISSGVQALTGLGQNLFSGRKKKERELEQYAKQSPLARESKSINDYYQQAMNRYKENPYQSQQYQVGARNVQRATAQGLGALQDRRSALGGISRLAQGQADALANLGANAEAQRNARFSQLGGAAQMKAAQDKYLFDINQMTPYNRMLALKQMKAQSANARAAAGLQTLAGGLSNAASIGMMAGSKGVPSTNNISEADITPAATFGSNYIPFNSFQENTPLNQGSGAFSDYYNRLNKGIGVSKKNAFGTNYNF